MKEKNVKFKAENETSITEITMNVKIKEEISPELICEAEVEHLVDGLVRKFLMKFYSFPQIKQLK